MTKIYALIASFFTTIFLVGCGSLYVSNNPDAIISTHSSRPFKYGFAYSREECEQYRGTLTLYNIKKGDVVAEVGAASGWLEGVYSVMTASVTYYVQDIDTSILNQDQLSKMVKHYSSVRQTPQTNTFKMVIGTKTGTNLPDGAFDKIIISNSYHEFKDPASMVKDLAKKIKPNGTIIIFDDFSNNYIKHKHLGCRITSPKPSMVIKEFEKQGLYLTNISAPINSLENNLFFEFSKQKSDDFKLKTSSVEKYIKILDQLNIEETYSNANLCLEIVENLKPYIATIERIYPRFNTYFSSLGDALYWEEMDLKKSINVFHAGLVLYPKSAEIYKGLGTSYCSDNNYVLSVENYKISLELDPYNQPIKEKINELNNIIAKKKSKKSKHIIK
ncbi:Methyltransferase domain-containing protein [Flexibacter flexilis DSM 6793]|uniref:Methyltransferase domain-containing protein n=1 Tax=Flexibacter flexilis DSM 6793 TaxID=927664 RepID=A0A1I1HVT1_9BACT|nr:methyltransferase domain-containing protein [Flexibacter flexilis]SFC25080.1 Methyltransferase domain-containing protein [Flexibacter flexilis DSM 6793]